MTEVLGDFIRALRAADVRITTSEAIEAGEALARIGYEDRELLRQALSQTLSKSVDEKQAFFETFDSFFAFRSFSEGGPAGDDAPGERNGEPGEGEGAGEGPARGEGGQSSSSGMGGGEGGAETRESLVDLLERGDRAALQERLADAARRVNLNDIRFFTQRGMFAVRILNLMGIEDVDDAIAEAEASGDPAERGRGERLHAARAALREEVRDYVEKQLAIFAANAGRKLREEILAETRLNAIERSDMRIMQELVRKMSKRLIALHARRRRIARRGQLDIRRTIRANVEYDGLLFHTIWKRRRLERPKVMALCDVSGSVSQTARFLLMFLYSLHEVLPNVRSFAFSGNLGEVTELFERNDVDYAMAETLSRFGGSTDYGEALETFERLAGDEVDHRTTVLILGDARNNNGEPRADILRNIHDRARRVIFLNPEPKSSWNTGDSVMRKYEACSDVAQVCATLKDLERVVSELLRTAI